MWNRFVRAIKSMFGGVVSSMEDPKLILEQNIRELNDQVPKMNENIATVKANLVMIRKERQKYEKLEAELVNKIKAAINANRDDIAENYAMQLEKARENVVSTAEQEKFAEQAYEKSLQVKRAFMREKDRKIREAREALQAHERAKWQSKIADTLEQFEVTGLDSTHKEMVSRLNEKTAMSEARMEIALDSVDTKTLEIEIDAEKMRASDLVSQFKREMGKSSVEAKPVADETNRKIDISLESDTPAPTEKDKAKTIGRQKG
ncbi:phage shock protein A (PspA) family protein [Cyclonatronum proteinivorum]|uniref:Phage shock protein A (PspA) family protein n=1 Tax=Cyclonatronum proteinivorum TaxID=1457365 RepID=A0A345UKB4_9BACT|nr:PspA/IM30 family protein [Cyclonatronum proteinivorum]AXJ00916.1 phage shock protein A (PspA) family protein [Cyclonatronum proteinivorum]